MSAETDKSRSENEQDLTFYQKNRSYFQEYNRIHRTHRNKIILESKRKRRVLLQAYVDTFKSIPYIDCGLSYEPFCMDCDHLDPKLKYKDISTLVQKAVSFKILQEELDKCAVRCVLCHRMKSFGLYPTPHPHPRDSNLRKRIRNRGILDKIKQKPCLDCEKTFHPCQMDFDHVRGNKFKNISALVVNSSVRMLLAEIDKTDLVCAVCHRRRTYSRMP